MSSPGSAQAPHQRVVRDAGERALIGCIRSRIPAPSSRLVIGIGDDAAVVEPDRGALQVLTTDGLVEGVHFDWRFCSPADVGHKALAVSVSDVASMGGTSRVALLSLMLPADLPLATLEGLLDGFCDLAGTLSVDVAGGNITRSPGPLAIDVTVAGSVRPRKMLRRGGARAGDALYVTGLVGAGAAGLAWLRAEDDAHRRPNAPEEALADCVTRYRRPEPRARVGSLLGRNRAATACMDTSDGLADAIRQVCEASGLGARIDAALLPVAPGAATWWAAHGEDPVTSALAGGDDYELLFAVPRRTRGRLRAVVREARGVPITRIGELTADRSIVVERDGRAEPLPAGFVHF